MNALRHIRTSVFGISMLEMSRIAGVDKSTVFRWEKDGAFPSRKPMQAIRDEAVKRALPWDDSLFFDEASSLKAEERAS